MAQTERDNVLNRTNLADNTAGAISPEDLRDALASTMGYGGIVLSAAGAPQVINGVGTGFTLVNIFDTITAQSSDVNTDGTVAALATTYDLTVGATGIYFLSFFASFSSSAANKLVKFRPHLNGSPGLIEVDRFVSTSGDTGVVAFNGVIPQAATTKIDVRVAIDTGTTNLTFLAAGFSAFRVG